MAALDDDAMKALVKYAAGDSAAPLLQLQKLVLEPLQSDIAEARGLDAVPDGPSLGHRNPRSRSIQRSHVWLEGLSGALTNYW